MLPAAAEVLGPVALETGASGSQRFVVRVPRAARGELTRALVELQARRSTRKLPHVRIQVDPRDLG